jgi:hypothetical protein
MLHRCPAPYKIRDMCGASAGHVRDILLFSVWINRLSEREAIGTFRLVMSTPM